MSPNESTGTDEVICVAMLCHGLAAAESDVGDAGVSSVDDAEGPGVGAGESADVDDASWDSETEDDGLGAGSSARATGTAVVWTPTTSAPTIAIRPIECMTLMNKELPVGGASKTRLRSPEQYQC